MIFQRRRIIFSLNYLMRTESQYKFKKMSKWRSWFFLQNSYTSSVLRAIKLRGKRKKMRPFSEFSHRPNLGSCSIYDSFLTKRNLVDENFLFIVLFIFLVSYDDPFSHSSLNKYVLKIEDFSVFSGIIFIKTTRVKKKRKKF